MSDVEAMYDRVIIERARHPRHQRRLERFDAEVRETNPLCGDRVTLWLRCDALGQVDAIGYEARACAICIASTDMMADMARGMATAEVDRFAVAFEAALASDAAAWRGRLAALAVFAPLHDAKSRIGCATLPWRGLARALQAGVAADAQ